MLPLYCEFHKQLIESKMRNSIKHPTLSLFGLFYPD